MPFDWEEQIKERLKYDGPAKKGSDFSRVTNAPVPEPYFFSPLTMAFTCPECGARGYDYQGIYRDYGVVLLACSNGHLTKVKPTYMPIDRTRVILEKLSGIKVIPALEIHSQAMKWGIKKAYYNFTEPNERYIYIYLSDNEFQLYRVGDMPTNFSVKEKHA